MSPVHLIGVVLVDTDRAVLFVDHFWHEPEWLPKSQITIRRDPDTWEVAVRCSPWIADQKQLVEFVERQPKEDASEQERI